jgi:hypothetical protein
MNTLYRENIAINGDFDLRGTAYDYDGYMLVGAVKVTADATAGAYIYMCARPGAGATAFSCGVTEGTAA